MTYCSPYVICFLLAFTLVASLSAHEKTRREFHTNVLGVGGFVTALQFSAPGMGSSCSAMDSTVTKPSSSETTGAATIAYKSLQLPLTSFDDVSVPFSCWYPITDNVASTVEASNSQQVKYNHRISVKRIGQLLAGWNFIPEFASRNFAFTPNSSLLDGSEIPFPNSPKVVFLAHGFLGSRFDLSHFAEKLANQGYVCISAEYPESLSASYSRQEGLDRAAVNRDLLSYVQDNLKPSSYSAIGHSMGCRTVLDMGDDSWARVLIAGRAPTDCSSPLLFISSVNDGAVTFGGPITIPESYTLLEESNIPSSLPSNGALIFDREDAPNHISFLNENVNEAMVGFLSPLLPVAQALSIPVLDFDKYQKSRDSVQTFEILGPIILGFLNQMNTVSIGEETTSTK